MPSNPDKKLKKYQCPVCGYPGMQRPPEHYYICACCGTEFENDDDEVSHEELRKRWIDSGCRWFNAFAPPDRLWSPLGQLTRSGFGPNGQSLDAPLFVDSSQVTDAERNAELISLYKALRSRVRIAREKSKKLRLGFGELVVSTNRNLAKNLPINLRADIEAMRANSSKNFNEMAVLINETNRLEVEIEASMRTIKIDTPSVVLINFNTTLSMVQAATDGLRYRENTATRLSEQMNMATA